MQPAQAVLTDHLTIPQTTCPATWCLLLQPEMCSVLVIVGDVIGEKSLEVSLVQRRSWLMMKKQYSTWKVSVGTVKKSIAAIASR